MEMRLPMEAPPGRPGSSSVRVADARSRHIADRRVSEGAHHLGQVAGAWHMITIELRDDVIRSVPPVVIEKGEVALLAFRPAGPVLTVVFGLRLAGRHSDSALSTPIHDFVCRPLGAEPDVERLRIPLRQ